MKTNVTNFSKSLSFKKDMEQLIRESERLAIARKYVSDTKYPDKDILVAILGTEKAEDEE